VFRAILLCLVLLLSGCATGGAITCPTLKKYSTEFQAKAASEQILINNDAPHIVQMLNDYGVERDAIRECQRRRKVK